MPIYGYICKNCDHTLDALQKMADDPLVDCPQCAAPELKRQLSAPRFRLKGQGWYETDFKKANQRNLAGDHQESTGKESTDKESTGKESTDKPSTDKVADAGGKSGDKGKPGATKSDGGKKPASTKPAKVAKSKSPGDTSSAA